MYRISKIGTVIFFVMRFDDICHDIEHFEYLNHRNSFTIGWSDLPIVEVAFH